MEQTNKDGYYSYYSARASLGLIAQRFKDMGVWRMVRDRVVIPQKKVRHEPLDKLLDCLIHMLAGGRGLVEINTRIRNDVGLQRAFGRRECAEQSTVSSTLNACSAETVKQMREAIEQIIQSHGQVMGRVKEGWLVLDVDMLGMVAGRQGEGVTKGYFSGGRDQRGRQLGRVLATDYDEMIVERLYIGKRQLEHSLTELIVATEQTLKMNMAQTPENAVCRVDGGGGTETNINYLLQRSYQVVTKIHNWNRAKKLATSVQNWQLDPKNNAREAGWVVLPHTFARPTRQLAVRTVTLKGNVQKFHYDVLVTSLSDEQLCTCFKLNAPVGSPWPLLYAYDLRGGGIETQNRCDRQGLALGHRNKRSFAAQEMLVLLGQLAHNFLIWMRNDLSRVSRRFVDYGIKRMIRDVLSIDGRLSFDQHRNLVSIELNPLHPLSPAVLATFPFSYERNVA
jgi:hypothetical protein